jgi:uncharacterized membrane protein YagU involved in acid resistance
MASVARDARGAGGAEGVNVSHRSGLPGFVRCTDERGATVLTVPDYRGNFFFNTLGNIVQRPQVGLLFVNFERGSLLHLQGHAAIDWTPPDPAVWPGAKRLIRFRVDVAVWPEPAGHALECAASGPGVRRPGAATTNSASPTLRASSMPKPSLRIILLAGSGAAVVEMIPVLTIQNALGVPPQRVFQAIASGLLGRGAFAGGAGTVWLGVFLHVVISWLAAAVFVAAALRWPQAARKTLLSGTVFGVGCYVTMSYVVLPLSAVAFPPTRELKMMAMSLAVHVLAFGLPIAAVTRRLLLKGSTVSANTAGAARHTR